MPRRAISKNKYKKYRNIFFSLAVATIFLWPTKYHTEPIKGCRNENTCSWQFEVKIPLYSKEFWTYGMRETKFPEEKSFNRYKGTAIIAFGIAGFYFDYRYRKYKTKE